MIFIYYIDIKIILINLLIVLGLFFLPIITSIILILFQIIETLNHVCDNSKQMLSFNLVNVLVYLILFIFGIKFNLLFITFTTSICLFSIFYSSIIRTNNKLIELIFENKEQEL